MDEMKDSEAMDTGAVLESHARMGLVRSLTEMAAQGGQATAHPTETWRRYDRIVALTSAAYVAHAEGQTPGTRVYLREAMAEIREWLDRLPPSSPAVTTEQETVERLAGEAVGDTPASLAAISQAHEMLGLWRARLLAQEKG